MFVTTARNSSGSSLYHQTSTIDEIRTLWLVLCLICLPPWRETVAVLLLVVVVVVWHAGYGGVGVGGAGARPEGHGAHPAQSAVARVLPMLLLILIVVSRVQGRVCPLACAQCAVLLPRFAPCAVRPLRVLSGRCPCSEPSRRVTKGQDARRSLAHHAVLVRSWNSRALSKLRPV